MFNSENDPNQDLVQNARSDRSDPNFENVDPNVSAQSVAVRKKQLESIFTKLIIFGLALGTVLGLTAYYLLNRFGLTKKPYQLEQEKIEREESTPVQKIHHLPTVDPQGDRFNI